MSKLKNGIKNLLGAGAAAVSGSTTVRMLADHPVDGKAYKANQVVILPASIAKDLCALGVADADPAAVEYCIQELKASPVEHAGV
jgi:hypothetical protein